MKQTVEGTNELLRQVKLIKLVKTTCQKKEKMVRSGWNVGEMRLFNFRKNKAVLKGN